MTGHIGRNADGKLHYVSNGQQHDPRLNLALEEYVVRHLDPRHSYLLVYINNPAVVVGKHQCVPREVNLKYLHEKDIPVLRRISGGGTVVHDRGNVNVSFITGHTMQRFNNYAFFLQPVIHSLRELSVPARLDGRNNIITDKGKLSGNAQFTSRGRMMSHGTLLFNSDLEQISQALRVHPEYKFETRSTPSVRSPMVNAADFIRQSMCIEDFQQKLVKNIVGGSAQPLLLGADDWESIRRLADEKYANWDWNYGQSPACGIKYSKKIKNESVDLSIDLKAGIISDIKIEGSLFNLNQKKTFEIICCRKRYDMATFQHISDEMNSNELFQSFGKRDWKELFV